MHRDIRAGNLNYKRQYRDIDAYANSEHSVAKRVKFHACLIRHIEARPLGFAAYGGEDPKAQALLARAGSEGLYRTCFKPGDQGKLVYVPGGACRIDLAEDLAACE